jgi:uncharacterized membrane protein YeaQ/YmgE (transglycosylase-associated protein family)
MPEYELSQNAQQWVIVVVFWIGRAVLPVRHPSGPLPTLLMGVTGSAAGLLALSYLLGDRPVNPIGPLGFLAATAGAFVLLILCRLVYACCPKRKENAEE